MVYQGRAAALAPIYLLRRDFTTEEEPVVLAQDPNLDVRRFAWSPDGTVGAGLYADLLVSIETGLEKRPLGDDVSAITFGDDGSTVYAVRVTADGANDVATLLAIDFTSGDSRDVASVSYTRPLVGEEAALAEAQFTDDGGTIRLFWMADNTVRLWVLGGGAWTIEPSDGEVTELEADALPFLWSPDGRQRVGFALNGSTTTIRLVNRAGDEQARATVDGRVSHARWSPDGDRIVFTVGRSASGGGVLQDLHIWDLGAGEDPAPMRITDTGAAFGAEWLGGRQIWDD
jgi:WD40 repeat protein